MIKKLKRFTIIAIIFAILIVALSSVAITLYYHENVLVHYIIADDYSYVVSSYDENTTFSPIKELPDSIDEKFGGVLWDGRMENNKDKGAHCYEYEHNGVKYLKVEIDDNKFIEFGDKSNNDTFYYVENT